MASSRSALEDLNDYIEADGPFDAVMAFSQGASLAATLIARPAGRENFAVNGGFKCAVFICAGKVFDPATIMGGKLRSLDAKVDGEVIRIPAAVIVGSKDPQVEQSLGLSKLCSAQGREVVDHGGGHEVPTSSKAATLRMVDAINKVIDRALSAQ